MLALDPSSFIFMQFSKKIRTNNRLVPHLLGNPMVDLRAARGTHAPSGPNSLNFMQFLGKFGKIARLAPPTFGKSWIRHWIMYDSV